MTAMKAFNYPMQTVRDFLETCTLPSKYGKARAEWLKDSRIKLHTLTSFSGIVLSLVPIVFLYMCSFCTGDPRLANHFDCMTTMHQILGDKPMAYIEKLKKLFPKLHAAVLKITDTLKPKLHHMHHIIDHMEWLGKLVSCFVTERKHRQIKDAALHVFRYMEHTVLVDVVKQMCQQLPVHAGSSLKLCPLHLRTGYYMISGTLFVEVRVMPAVGPDISLREKSSPVLIFKECRQVVDACIWHPTETEHVVRVCVPVIFQME